MAEFDWHKCRFLESIENLKPLVKMRFGREPSSTVAYDIAACLQQGRLFYEAAASSPLEIRPLQMFYGMVAFSRALSISKCLLPLATQRQSHGLRDISEGNSRLADLRLRIEGKGTFQEFNDVVSDLSRICFLDRSIEYRVIYIPSAKSGLLEGMTISLRDLLGHIPDLDELYRLTFGEDSSTANVTFAQLPWKDKRFTVVIHESRVFGDRSSLLEMIARCRARFPFLNYWRFLNAERHQTRSAIEFVNCIRRPEWEFDEANLLAKSDGFAAREAAVDSNELFTPSENLAPLAGGWCGRQYAICPVGGCYVSEFAFHYLTLFLLSSLVRYRPRTWVHAISRSVTLGNPADDRALSLIERFLDLNTSLIPETTELILNPRNDSLWQ